MKPTRILIGLCLFAAVAHADVKPAGIFSDHAVLPQGAPVPVWGTDDPGTTVTVTFAGQQKSATAGADGRWMVRLDALQPSGDGQSLTAAGSSTLTAPGPQVSLYNKEALPASPFRSDIWPVPGQPMPPTTALAHATALLMDVVPPAEPDLTVATDRPDALYHRGEKVTFTIHLKDHNQPAATGAVTWTISKDGVKPIQTGTATIVNGQAQITGSLDEPGFLHCEVSIMRDKTKLTALAAGGIDIDQIKPSLPAPDDFDAFWADQKKRLAAVPINVKLTPVPPPPDRPGAETFDLQADCIGAPVSGYYARPIGAKPHSCPAVMLMDGAGVQSSDLLASTRYGQKGCISLHINAHGIPNGKPKDFYAALAAGDLKDYRIHGRESRDTYYFLGMYLRVLRAIDALASQPEWDGRTFVLIGGSQGGAQAMVGAALDPRVTFVVAMNPAMCDHTGMVVGRVAGWPKLVPVDAAGKPDAAALETSRYFDGVNFAARIKAPLFGWEGFLDVVAPPTSVYAAYNAVPGKKQIINDPTHGHATDGFKVWPMVSQVVFGHIAEQAKAAPAAVPEK